MGVTLERVQFKFASIIGELCSEPDILSQFAVWVDLRLAEYKLKGSISLDCSGETPDPIWLQGILSALLAQKMARQKTLLKPSGHNHDILTSGAARNFSKGKSVPAKAHGSANFQSPHSNRDDVTPLRLSPVIKEEPPDDGVYPVTFHVHEVVGSSRKRSATETITSQDEAEQSDVLYSHSTPKQRRSDASGNMDNESLMSIIGIGEHSNNGSTISSDIIKNTTDRILQSEEAASVHQDEMSIAQQDTPLFPVQMGPGTSPAANSVGTHSRESQHRIPTPLNQNYQVPQNNRAGPVVLNAIKMADRYRKQTLSYVKRFERWMSAPPRNENRRMLDLPVDQLDEYLAEFFGTIKTDEGRDYTYQSLITLRSVFGRYLQQSSYPYHIRSKVFHRSQQVFHERRLCVYRQEASPSQIILRAGPPEQPFDISQSQSFLESITGECDNNTNLSRGNPNIFATGENNIESETVSFFPEHS